VFLAARRHPALRLIHSSVIVTTYNRPDALAAVLDGFVAQSAHEFELLVADDGSTADTGALVEAYAARAPFPIRHVWQEDRGFRAGAARNKALARAETSYVIFTDGDCVPPQDFVARHLGLRERGCFLAANRILLGPTFTARVLAERMPVHRFTAMRWLAAWARRDVNRALPLVRLPDGPFRKRRPQQWEGVKTCNFSAWREDLLKVNGFDEGYAGWGLEDSDLVIRLLHAGVRHKSARWAAPVFHLWHPDNDRRGLAENRRRLDEILASNRMRAANGVDRYIRVVDR
jgi:glycosyltransferase involved in cell wall biosynthesis